MKNLAYADAPHDWALCFQNECPLHDTCLRYAVGRLMPSNVTHHETVLPTAREEGNCCHYVEAKRVVMAQGMTDLFKGLPRWEAEELRKRVKAYFGSHMRFYRYRSGLYPITPEMQERIAHIFNDFKPGLQPHFDNISETFHFPKP